jgi:hypothetical protein
LQEPCPGCGELKLANTIEKRLHGTAKCHTCVAKRKVKELSKAVTRSTAKRRSRPKPK